MPILLATWITALAAAYLGLGLLFAIPFALRWVGRVDPIARSGSWGFRVLVIPFALRWVGRVDPVAREGSWGFRVLIIPGAALLWPLLLARLARRVTSPPEERNAHRQAVRTRTPARNPR